MFIGGNGTALIGGDAFMLNGGDAFMFIGGNGTALIGGDAFMLNGGDAFMLIGGDATAFIGGDATALIGGDALEWIKGKVFCSLSILIETIEGKLKDRDEGALIESIEVFCWSNTREGLFFIFRFLITRACDAFSCVCNTLSSRC